MEEHAYKRDFSGLFCALLFSAGLHLLLFWPAARHGSQAASAPLSATLAARAGTAPLQPVTPPTILAAPRSPELVREAVQRRSNPMQAIPVASPVVLPAMPATATQVHLAMEGLDAGGLRQYRVRLAAQIQRMGLLGRNIPAGMKGSMQLSVSVLPNGMVNQVLIDRSSGNVELDQSALHAIRQAAMQMEAPEVLRGNAFVIALPLEFGD